MTGIISPENQAILRRELAAVGADDDMIDEALETLNVAARVFVKKQQAKRENTKRAYGHKKLLAQIEKVWNNTGPQREAAYEKAIEMGLEPGHPSGFKRPFHDAAEDLREIIRQVEAGVFKARINSNRAEHSKQMFTARCMVVWIKAGGKVRFSSIGDADPALFSDMPHDAGPLGRFLTASQADAYGKAGLKLPLPSGMRAMGRRMVNFAYEWTDTID